MLKIQQEIKNRKLETKIRMLLTIHDELLFEIKKDIIKEATDLIQKVMEGAYGLKVPIKVAMKSGDNWGELH